MYPFTWLRPARAGSSVGISLATARISPKVNATDARSPRTVSRARRRSLRIRRRRLRGAALRGKSRTKAAILAVGGRDHGEHVVPVALELRGPEAADRRKLRDRCRARGGKRTQCAVVQDDVGGHLVRARAVEPPCPEALEETLVARRRRRVLGS